MIADIGRLLVQSVANGRLPTSHRRSLCEKRRKPIPRSTIGDRAQAASHTQTWMDGIVLQAIAEKRGVPIVVFKRDQDVVRRYTLAHTCFRNLRVAFLWLL